jgi:hypothetical protein
MEAKIEIIKQAYAISKTSKACHTWQDFSADYSFCYCFGFGSQTSKAYRQIIQLLNDNNIIYTTDRIKVPLDETKFVRKFYITETIVISRSQTPQSHPIYKGQKIFINKDYDDLMRDVFKSFSDEEIIEYEDTEPGRRCWFKTPQKECSLRLWNVMPCGKNEIYVEAELQNW